MDNSAIINELLSIEASASLLAERANNLRKKLAPASTGSSKKRSGLTDEEMARVLAKARKTRLKQLQK